MGSLAELEAMFVSPTHPGGRLLRSLGIHNAEDAQRLSVLPVLAALPMKPREKYGKRKKLTAEERSEQTKRRNREHARSTRARKKLIMEALQVQVDELHRRLEPVADGGGSNRRSAGCNANERGNAGLGAGRPAQSDEKGFQEARKNTLRAFFDMGASPSDSPRTHEAWAALVAEQFQLSTPVLPHRAPRSGGGNALVLSQEPRDSVGVAALARETEGLPRAILGLLHCDCDNALAAAAATAALAPAGGSPWPSDIISSGSSSSSDGSDGSGDDMEAEAEQPAAADAATVAAGEGAKRVESCAVRWELHEGSIMTTADKAMCNWTMHVKLADAAGAALEPVAVKGMAKCRFVPRSERLVAVDLRFDAMGLCSLLEASTGQKVVSVLQMGPTWAPPLLPPSPPPVRVAVPVAYYSAHHAGAYHVAHPHHTVPHAPPPLHHHHHHPHHLPHYPAVAYYCSPAPPTPQPQPGAPPASAPYR